MRACTVYARCMGCTTSNGAAKLPRRGGGEIVRLALPADSVHSTIGDVVVSPAWDTTKGWGQSYAQST